MKDRANLRAVKKLEKIAKLVEEKEQIYAPMTDDELAGQTAVLRQRYADGETLDDLLPDAYAVCREASKRVLKQRHFHVQILGGIALHQGRICQMATGEGKTLTETLPAYLNALSGNGVHVVTVNEYLATRDMEWMGKVFRFLGLTVGVTLHNQTAKEKRQAYACDITYGTNNEFGFDYLRDNMAKSRASCVQRGLNFVIIDEVDSILIDEARTPLIISGPSGKSSEMYVTANRFVCTLQNSTNVDNEGKPLNDDEEPNGDYVVDRKQKSARFSDKGIAKAEKYFKIENLSSPENTELNHYLNNALRAHAIMHRDDDYIVEKGAIVIVDSFTGRKMEGRRFSHGLHQAIEAKEHVTIKEENKTLATITFQNYFRLYHKLSGMTGTAKTEEREFNAIYNIDVVVIPTNKPVIRIDCHDQVYSTRKAKIAAIVAKIKECRANGQPVLVGTTSVEKSVELADELKKSGIKRINVVLNAAKDENKSEADIISDAGSLMHDGKGDTYASITIATNMAGRGTDIVLGGDEEHIARRNMERDLTVQMKKNASKLSEKDKQDIHDKIEIATNFGLKDEYSVKLQNMYKEYLDKATKQVEQDRKLILEAGGLCVIGTERHDSRRIDDQLRGRSGRQGDPGTSVFYISAEDDMVRIFGGDMMQRVMSFMRMDEDTPIESKLVTKAIESAQKRIEGIHFSSRKNVLQYDDVNNQQRKVIYKERNRILDNDDVHSDILEMVGEYCRYALAEACDSEEDVEQWDLDKVNQGLAKYFAFEQPILTAANVISARQVCDELVERCRDYLNGRLDEASDGTVVPFREAERFVLLRTIDNLWMEHLDALDELRQGVGLQSIGQHDPLGVYKKEAYEMFEKLNEQIRVQTLRMLTFGKLVQTVRVNVAPSEPDNNEQDNSEQGAAPAQDRPLTKQEEYALKRQQRKAEKNKK